MLRFSWSFKCISGQIDLEAFEELFKTKAQDTEADKLRMQRLQEAAAKRGTSIIDVNRAKNLCKRRVIF